MYSPTIGEAGSPRSLAAGIGFTPERAAFVTADVYDAAEAVPDTAYDIVRAGTWRNPPGATSDAAVPAGGPRQAAG
ncbi:hypothetical protein AMK26_24120 [Streptomyces sp. CB03234]|nr:hypothetical protein AMK26_24120 [Streptomyces sp. CB03234]